MKKAVLLLSGGLDSATTLAIAKSEGYDVYCLSFSYGQRHGVELEYAKKIAKHLGAKEHKIAEIDLRIFGGSALTDEIDVPKNRDVAQEEIPVTYVPARNTIFLSFALAYAETIGAFDIFIGANAVDYSGYPDCRPEYIEAFENMANLATKVSVEGKGRFSVKRPLIHMTKAEIIKTGRKLGVNYDLTLSCYSPIVSSDNTVIPCGECDSCVIRKKGFAEADI